MFKKALIGIDFSPAELPLIKCLPELKRWGIHSVALAHAVRVGYIEGAEYGHEKECKLRLENHAVALRESGLHVSISVVDSGAPAEALTSLAAEYGADIIVVGSRSHSFAEELFLGSVAGEVIRTSEIPVLIERIESTETDTAEDCAVVCEQKLTRILLATDLSDHSRSAEKAAAFLAPRAAETDCLTVLPDKATPGDTDETRTAREQKLTALLHEIEGRGGHGRIRYERGEPARVIAHVAQEGYSLVIVGKHGRNWIKGTIIGSTAAKVCEIAKRPVLVVP